MNFDFAEDKERVIRMVHQVLGHSAVLEAIYFVGGGNISTSLRAETSMGTIFLKYTPLAQTPDLFQKEALGLAYLRRHAHYPVPSVLHEGQTDGLAFLALEYIASGTPHLNYWEKLGEQLAATHQKTNTHFGWHHHNYIGSLEQNNTAYTDGIQFYIERRIMAQAGLAFYNYKLSQEHLDGIKLLCKKLPELLPQQPPSLLHGDLWSGNVMVNSGGQPLLIDPCPHYGLREAELAFTMLFGGFDHPFYQAYQNAFPTEPHFDKRVELYNLYPLLVHVNLFGASYLPPILRTIKRFLK